MKKPYSLRNVTITTLLIVFFLVLVFAFTSNDLSHEPNDEYKPDQSRICGQVLLSKYAAIEKSKNQSEDIKVEIPSSCFQENESIVLSDLKGAEPGDTARKTDDGWEVAKSD